VLAEFYETKSSAVEIAAVAVEFLLWDWISFFLTGLAEMTWTVLLVVVSYMTYSIDYLMSM
jgi:uncharacterized membrane protein YcaP (DUF421 family)